MMKRVAANKVMTNDGILASNLMIERDDAGIVVRLVPLAGCQVEPSSTAFYNGIITTEINTEIIRPGLHILSIPFPRLSAGYNGRLLLWQHISLTNLTITPETTVTIL